MAEDATATFDRIGHNGQLYKAQDVHNISLASLHDKFATIVTTKEMISYHTHLSSHV